MPRYKCGWLPIRPARLRHRHLLFLFLSFHFPFLFLISNRKIILSFENFADLATNRRAPRRPPWATAVATPTAVTYGGKGGDRSEWAPREPTTVGHGGRPLPPWGTAAATPI
jgi:hypothetical protein